MKVSKGRSQPEIAADIPLLNSLHGSGSTILVSGFDCDSPVGGPPLFLNSLWRTSCSPASTTREPCWDAIAVFLLGLVEMRKSTL